MNGKNRTDQPPAAPVAVPRLRRGSFLDGPIFSQPLLLLAVAIAVLYYGRDLLIPMAFALTLNFLLTPAVMQLEKLRLPRVPAVLLVMALASGLVGTVSYVVGSQLLNVISDLPNYRFNIQDKMAALNLPKTGALGHAVASVTEIKRELSGTPSPAVTPEIARSRMSRREREKARLEALGKPTPVVVVPQPVSQRQYLQKFITPVLKPLGIAIMVFIFTIYLLMKREDLRNRLLLLAGIGHLNVMTQALNDAAGRISTYLVMNVLVNASYGLLIGVALHLLHVPYATLWGTLAGILRLVPYAGTIIGGAMPILFSLAVFDSWWPPLYIFLLIFVTEMCLGYFIEPWLYGSHTGISSLALVTTAIVWTLLWGLPGLVLSTPLTVCLIVLGRHAPQLSFLHVLLGEDAELTPDAHFYERLLAMDQAEAHAVADSYLEEHTLNELYDGVVLPALSLAESDRHKGSLDEVTEAFLFQSVAELVAELTDYVPLRKDTAPAPPPPAKKKFTVVCIAANDRADEIPSAMLAQLLEQAAQPTMLLSHDALSPEILARFAHEPETVFCISALPPFAFSRARALCQRMREQLPRNRIVVGLWGTNAVLETLRERFGNARPDAVVRTLAQAMAQIQTGHCEPDVEVVELLESAGSVPVVNAAGPVS